MRYSFASQFSLPIILVEVNLDFICPNNIFQNWARPFSYFVVKPNLTFPFFSVTSGLHFIVNPLQKVMSQWFCGGPMTECFEFCGFMIYLFFKSDVLVLYCFILWVQFCFLALLSFFLCFWFYSLFDISSLWCYLSLSTTAKLLSKYFGPNCNSWKCIHLIFK